MREIVKRETIEASIGRRLECKLRPGRSALASQRRLVSWTSARGRWGVPRDELFIDCDAQRSTWTGREASSCGVDAGTLGHDAVRTVC